MVNYQVIEWDENKNALNRKKHGVSFEEAATVFNDSLAVEFHDPDHSKDEDRFLIIGLSEQIRHLVVCFCERQNNDIIRIISARKLNKQEMKDFKKGVLK